MRWGTAIPCRRAPVDVAAGAADAARAEWQPSPTRAPRKRLPLSDEDRTHTGRGHETSSAPDETTDPSCPSAFRHGDGGRGGAGVRPRSVRGCSLHDAWGPPPVLRGEARRLPPHPRPRARPVRDAPLLAPLPASILPPAPRP